MRTATIIIPTHDHALMLPLAIDSARMQTIEDVAIVSSETALVKTRAN
jgi:hypothetical protein